MGNKTSDTLLFTEIEIELKKKQQERTILFVGLSKSGKSTIINQIVAIDNYINKHDKNKFIEYAYDLKSFTIKELTDIKIQNYSSQCYKHLTLVYQFAPNYRTTKLQFKSLMKINQFKENNKAFHDLIGIDGHRIDYELLLYGFIRQIKHNNIYANTPPDIIYLIKSFIKTFITSHKIKCKSNIYDLWELPCLNTKDCYIWSELFQYINVLMFVCDISQYDEFYEYDKSINKLENCMDLFKMLVNDKQLIGIRKIVFLNKLDVFKEKIERNKVSLTKCPVFSKYDEKMNHRYKAAIKEIKGKFKDNLPLVEMKNVSFYETIGVDKNNITKALQRIIYHDIR